MTKPKLVVIGNGMAGIRCVEEILALAPDLYDITIFGNEPRPNYNRIMLSKVLQGDADFDDIVLNDWAWYEERGIRLYAGHAVNRIDTAARVVESEQGVTAFYDKLILATGSSAFIPGIPGASKPGVIAFRSVDDCVRMMESASACKKAAVVGGGLLGLEAARGLLNLGMEVAVVHNANYLMNRQLDRASAEMLREELEEQGMQFLLGKLTERIVGRKRAEGLVFSDGSRLQADLVVMAVGIRPNVELGKPGGIETNRAFVVNDYMETNVPGVYAVGECAEHEGIVYGLVAPLYEQGKVLAARLCGRPVEPYRGSIPYAQLKVSGVDVFSAGAIHDPDARTVFSRYDGIRKTYQKIVATGGKISGAILFGDVTEGPTLLGYLKRGANVSVLEKAAASEGGGSDRVAAMPDEETVCQCNGVTKGAILKAVAQGCGTVDAIRERTKASGSCGGCKPVVAAVLKLAASSPAAAAEEEIAVCGCTKLGHEALKEALAAEAYDDAKRAMEALGWRKPEGCPVCRAAVRYYLGAKDGSGGGSTFRRREPTGTMETTETMETAFRRSLTVTPRLPAGVVRPEQLRRIADMIEKYGASAARLTDEGRIDIPGLTPASAKAFREELGIPLETSDSLAASVRVFVGSSAEDGEGAARAERLGTELERRLFDLGMPHPVTAAVVAGPADRAGLLVRDLGLSLSPAGWELFAGGFAERPLRQAQLLVSGATEEEALEIAVACLQEYRETAYYGEPLWKWLERFGLVPIREKLLDPQTRDELLEGWFKARHSMVSA